MSKMKRVFFIAISFFLLTGSVFSKGRKDLRTKAPDWLNGTSASFPSSEYFIYIGEGSERKSAELDAINGICTLFGQDIKTSTASSRRMAELEKGNEVLYSQASSINQDILQEVNQDDVVGIELKDYYIDTSTKKNYALAVMNKTKAAQIYSDLIQKNQETINELFKQIETSIPSENTIPNFARLDFAIEIAKKTEKYLKRLSVLNSTKYREIEKNVSTVVSIQKKQHEMAENIPICVVVEDDSDGRITKAFQEAVSSFGFNSSKGSNERYKIFCKPNFTESVSSDGKTFFCEYSADCALIDTFTGETLVPIVATGREGSTTFSNAKVRSKQKISAGVKSIFKNGFDNYLQTFSYSGK